MGSQNINTRLTPTDVLIIGGGPAGLTVALGISRLLHTSIVFSSGYFRNQLATHMHGMPSWEHRDPAEFRQAVKDDILAHYDTVAFEDATIETIERHERDDGSSLFKATDATGKEWWGRKVVLASGIKDIMLDIPGYTENWAQSIFHCLFCHGYEERGAESAGILAIGHLEMPMMALFVSRFANRLANKVTIYTNDNATVTAGIQSAISELKSTSKTAQNVSIDPRRITRFVKGTKNADIVVHFDDGTSKTEAFLGHAPKFTLNGNWDKKLGLELSQSGQFKLTPPFNETSMGGVFAVGDCALMQAAVAPGVGSAAPVSAGLCAQLGAED